MNRQSDFKNVASNETISDYALNCLAGFLVDSKFTNISGTSLKVYAALLRYANSAGEAWPSQQSLMKVTGLSENSIRKGLAEIVILALAARKPLPIGMKGRKFKLLPQKQVVISSPGDEILQPKIPKGYFCFSNPSSSNRSFYLRNQVFLPRMGLVKKVLLEFENNDFSTLWEIIQNINGLPARLFGLTLALKIGDPWNFLLYAKQLAEWQEFDVFAYEYSLSQLGKTRNEFRGNRILNHSTSFKQLFKRFRREIPKLKELHSEIEIGSIIRKFIPEPDIDDVECWDDPNYKPPVDPYLGILRQLCRFRLEEEPGKNDLYLQSPIWFKNSIGGMLMSHKEEKLLTRFIWEVFFPIVLEVRLP